MMIVDRHHDLQNAQQHFHWSAERIHLADQFLRVMRKHRRGFLFIHLESPADDFFIRVIVAVLHPRPSLHASDHFIQIQTAQMNDLQHVDVLIERLRLLHAARNAVENEQVI